MAFLEPVTLQGAHARLEPLSQDQCDGLTEAVRDGELWKLWYTFIPTADSMQKEIDRRLALYAAGAMLPFTVYDAAGKIAGMKAALNYDNLINVEVEKRRLQFSFDKLIVSPEMKEIGVGDVKDDRMARAIGIIVEGYQLARAPAPSEIFSREFLPPRAERELVYTAN